MKLYKWQEKAVADYTNAGTIKAVTGAGKTLVGMRIIKTLCAERNIKTVLVTAHRKMILAQWKHWAKQELDKVPVAVTYKTFHRAYRERGEWDLLIVDECHRSISPKFQQMYNVNTYDYILGLSATPGEAVAFCGNVFAEVDYSEANVASFKVFYHNVSLTPKEKQQYEQFTNRISALYRDSADLDPTRKHILAAVILKRRALVYSITSRIPYAAELIEKLMSESKRKILVICRRTDQANAISVKLKDKGLRTGVYHSKELSGLVPYASGKIDILLSVDMLKEGFDDTDTDTVVIASTALSEDFIVQSVGRALRFKPNKKAQIHVLLASGTTDMTALNYTTLFDYQLVGFTQEEVAKQLSKEADKELRSIYYSGKRYSFSACRNIVWRKGSNGMRINQKPHLIIDILKAAKPSGGAFVVSKTGIYIKKHDVGIVKISDETPEFEDAENTIEHKYTFDELFSPE